MDVKAQKLMEALDSGEYFNATTGRKAKKVALDSATHRNKLKTYKYFEFRGSIIYYKEKSNLDALLEKFTEFEQSGDAFNLAELDAHLEKYVKCVAEKKFYNVSSGRCVKSKGQKKSLMQDKKNYIIYEKKDRKLAKALVERHKLSLPDEPIDGARGCITDLADDTARCKKTVPKGQPVILVGDRRVTGTPEQIRQVEALEKKRRESALKEKSPKEKSPKKKKSPPKTKEIERSPDKAGASVCRFCNKDCSNTGCTVKRIRAELKGREMKVSGNKPELCDRIHGREGGGAGTERAFMCEHCNKDCSNKGCTKRLLAERLRRDRAKVYGKKKEELCDMFHGRESFQVQPLRQLHRCNADCKNKGCTAKTLREKIKRLGGTGYSGKNKADLCHMYNEIKPSTGEKCELDKIDGASVTDGYITMCVWETVDVSEWNAKVERINKILASGVPLLDMDHYEDIDATLEAYLGQNVVVIEVPETPEIDEPETPEIDEPETPEVDEPETPEVDEQEDAPIADDGPDDVPEPDQPLSEAELTQEALSRMAVRDVPEPARLSRDAQHVIPPNVGSQDIIGAVQRGHARVFLGAHGLKANKKSRLLKEARVILGLEA